MRGSKTILRKIICTPKAPRPVAPYNQAVVVERTMYVSAILGLNKDKMKLVPGGVVPETGSIFKIKITYRVLSTNTESASSSVHRYLTV